MGSTVNKATFTTRDWVVTVDLKKQTVTAALTERGAKHKAKHTYDEHSLSVMLGRFRKGDTEYINRIAAKVFNSSIGIPTKAERKKELRAKIAGVDKEILECDKHILECKAKCSSGRAQMRERGERMLATAEKKLEKLRATRDGLQTQIDELG
jgi:chromosome segregation ATPase